MAETSRIEELRRRVQKDPASIAFAQLAEEYRRAGRFQEAIETCESGLGHHPGYLSARVTLGRAFLEQGELDAAQLELKQVLRAAPENLAALRGLAEVHHRRGELREALALYRSALEFARQDPDLEHAIEEISRELEPRSSAPPVVDGLSFEEVKDTFLSLSAADAPPADAPPLAEPSATLSTADAALAAASVAVPAAVGVPGFGPIAVEPATAAQPVITLDPNDLTDALDQALACFSPAAHAPEALDITDLSLATNEPDPAVPGAIDTAVLEPPQPRGDEGDQADATPTPLVAEMPAETVAVDEAPLPLQAPAAEAAKVGEAAAAPWPVPAAPSVGEPAPSDETPGLDAPAASEGGETAVADPWAGPAVPIAAEPTSQVEQYSPGAAPSAPERVDDAAAGGDEAGRPQVDALERWLEAIIADRERREE